MPTTTPGANSSPIIPLATHNFHLTFLEKPFRCSQVTSDSTRAENDTARETTLVAITHITYSHPKQADADAKPYQNEAASVEHTDHSLPPMNHDYPPPLSVLH